MHMPLRRMTALPGALLLATLAACSTPTAPSSTTPSPTAQPSEAAGASPSVDPAALAAYGDAICPLFDRILLLDPRLAAIREAGAGGGDMAPHAVEFGEVADELGAIVTALDEVPDWEPGRRLQFELIGSLHAIRAQLLAAESDPARAEVAEAMAALPYIASVAMDRAMAAAVEGGMSCEGGS